MADDSWDLAVPILDAWKAGRHGTTLTRADLALRISHDQ